MRLVPALACCLWLGVAPAVHAGLHCTQVPPFPRAADANVFLKQLMYLRDFGPSDPSLNKDDSPQRKQCLAAIAQLKQKQQQGALSADELADLCYYLIRVRGTASEPAKYLTEAIDILVPATRQHPRHFALHANLGTAFHLLGSPDELQRAEDYLSVAVGLAPPAWREFEQTHLRLVKVRRRAALHARPQNLGGRSLEEPEPDQFLTADPRVRMRFAGPSGQWEVGTLAAEEQAKLIPGSLPAAMAHVEQLLIWMPYDARLVWLLGELANAQGQVRAAHAAFQNATYNNPALSGILPRMYKLENYLQWQDLLSRSPTGPDGWLAQNLGSGLLLATPGDGIAPLTWYGHARLGLKSAGSEDMPEMGGGNATEQNPGNGASPRVLLQLTTKHWLLIGAGLLLILLLLAFQYREWRRRRGRRAPSPT